MKANSLLFPIVIGGNYIPKGGARFYKYGGKGGEQQLQPMLPELQ